jgi:hypothetical protein
MIDELLHVPLRARRRKGELAGLNVCEERGGMGCGAREQ